MGLHGTQLYTAAKRTMRDKKQEIEFHVTVNDQKLEETKWQDGNTYVTAPLFSNVSYGVEFKEEIKSHGTVETVSQEWPVCPYKIAVKNLSSKILKIWVLVDGQKVGRKFLSPSQHHVFAGIPTDVGVKEFLFSLPRFVTLKERSSGKGMAGSRASDLGTIKVVWQEAVMKHSKFVDNHRSFTAKSFNHANKSDAKATGGGAGSGSSDKAHASSTRAGKVIKVNEPRACKVWSYKTIGERKEARLLYRTQHRLEEMGVLERTETDAESAERTAKRERRRKRAKLQLGGASSQSPVVVEDAEETGAESAERTAKRERRRKKAKLQLGGASSTSPVDVEDVQAEGPPPVPVDADDAVIVL